MKVNAQSGGFLESSHTNADRQRFACNGTARGFNGQPADITFHAIEPEPDCRSRNRKECKCTPASSEGWHPVGNSQAQPASSTGLDAQGRFMIGRAGVLQPSPPF
jgi:hypothetical protein